MHFATYGLLILDIIYVKCNVFLSSKEENQNEQRTDDRQRNH